ncbi:MAG: 5'-methylthioadenosine/adenosylhomocysteine nucleosidase [Clostridia bacterium]
MKYIGIIGAMQIEIDKLLSLMTNVDKKIICNICYYMGNINNSNVIICRCDEGKVNAAICTQTLIMSFDIKYIINVGVAGSLDNNLNIFDLVIAKNTVQHDYDITALGYEKGLVLGINKVYIPCDESLSKNMYLIAKQIGKAMYGTIASGDVFVTDENLKNSLKEKFNCIAVDMESAVIAHVCLFNNIPYICMRVISDTGSKIEFREFLNESVSKITDVIVNFLNKMEEK